MLTLVGRSLRRIAVLAATILTLLAAFQILLIVVAASVANINDFSRLIQFVPAFMQQMFGLSLLSFDGMALLGFFEPLVIMMVVQFTIYLATEHE